MGSIRIVGIARVRGKMGGNRFSGQITTMYGCHLVGSERAFIACRGCNTRLERREVDGFLLRRTTRYNHAHGRLWSPSINSHRHHALFGSRGAVDTTRKSKSNGARSTRRPSVALLLRTLKIDIGMSCIGVRVHGPTYEG